MAVCGKDDLPLADRDRPWDADAARKRMRQWATDEGNLVPEKFKQGHFWYDDDKPENVTSYKLPFADVIDGELHAVPRGIFAVAAVLMGARGGVDIPEEDIRAIKRKVSRYYERMELTPPWEREERQVQCQRTRQAEIRPTSYDPQAHKITVVWSTGARVLRSTWGTEWWEELDLAGARLERLNSVGIMVLDHEPSVRAVIGRVIPGTARVVDGEGVADILLSRDPQDAATVQKIIDGIIPGVSCGYLVYKEEVAQADDGRRLVRVVDWEPYEISVVAMPADGGARIRAHTMEGKMETNDRDTVITEVQIAERRRAAAIEASAVRMGLAGHPIVRQLITEGVPEEEARQRIMALAAQRDEEHDRVAVHVTRDEQETQAQGVVEYLCHRGAPSLFPLTDRARQWVGCSLIDLAREALRARGYNVSGWSREEIAREALRPHRPMPDLRARWLTMSDFPYLLGDVANKTLRKAYELQQVTFRPFVIERRVPDFSPQNEVLLSEAPALEELPEGAEYAVGVLNDDRARWQLKTFGVRVRISRQAILSDRLDAFARLPQMLGARAAQVEADVVYGLLTSNPLMSDGKSLFHADHKNVAATASVPTIESIAEGRRAMRRQVGPNGAVLNILPGFILVPASLELTVSQLIASIVPSEASKVTPEFVRTLTPIVEPRLDAISTTAWYLIAQPSLVDTIVVGYLEGQAGPYTETYTPFERDGIEIKVRHDFGAAVLDWRAFFYNPGA